jgi:hypothetical protein
LLIEVFRDESAIQWRFNQIKARVMPFDKRSEFEAHSVGSLEAELDGLGFAKPLISLGETKYLPLFLSLLDFSIEVIKTDNDGQKWPYGNYLWKIVTAYVSNLKTLGSFNPLFELQKWFEEKSPKGEARWLLQRLVQLRKEYVNYLGAKELYGRNS